MLSFYALWLIGVGSVLGAVGASTLFWTEKAKELLEKQARMPQGKGRAVRKKMAAIARKKLENRDVVRDWITLFGWGFVIVGSVFAIIGDWPEHQ